MRRMLRLLVRVSSRGARLILTAISATLYGAAFALGFIVRVLIVVRAWTAGTVLLGWEDAMPKSVAPPQEFESYAPPGWPEPNTLRRERRRDRMKKVS